MKALFNRFNRGLSKDKEKLSSSTDIPASGNKEKLELPPLREWPPSQRVTSTPSSFHSAKPLPDISARPLPPIDPLPAIPVSQTNSQASTDTSHRSFANSPPPQIPASTFFTPPVGDRGGLGLGLITSTHDEIAPPSSPDSSSDQHHSPERPRPQQQSVALRGARKATDASTSTMSPASIDAHNQKKVAFISPPPTPAPLQRALIDPDTPPPEISSTIKQASAPAPLKTTVTRFQAAHGADARGSSSTASSSKVNVVPKAVNGNSAKATSTRTALSPNSQKTFADNASIVHSMRSTTPYSQTSQSTSRILSTASWSEAAEEDLVSNLGPRERTRQEVLWEIVASEERYVAELMKLKETFIEPLLHPFASPPPTTSPTPMIHDDREDNFYARIDSPRESLDNLPIAARFLSPITGLRSETPVTTAASATITVQSSTSTKDNTPNIDGDSLETDEEEAADQLGKTYARNGAGSSNQSNAPASRNRQQVSAIAAAVAKFNHPRSPYNASSSRNGASKSEKGALPFPSRSHQSLPPPPRLPQGSSASLGRQSILGMPPPPQDRENSYTPTATTADRRTDKTSTSRVLKKLRRSITTPDMLLPDSVSPHQLPEDLRKVLEVLENGIFDGHVILSENLRKRYEEQYPLVRSLADVFVSNSHILHEYATYVLHLERALEQVDAALSTASDSKKPKNQDAAVWLKVCRVLHRLEETAVEKGETGLAISLSKPFQRLLKYPLLFQNLLYHTDPSTFEYESTLQMVAEVETIVRSIEDEKIQKEERDKTRDAFARIEGLEKVKQLALPKPSRVLVEERLLASPSSSTSSPLGRPPPPSAAANKNVKGKSSFRKLSDVLHTGNGIGGKKDLWLVSFNDVVLRCQRTGVTSLPLVSSTTSRTNSLPELQAKAKYATTGRKGAHTKPRNLYKFLKIENWAIGDGTGLKEGVVAMEEVVRSRADVHSGVPTTGRSSTLPEDEDEDDDGNDSSDSDRKSKMSFSYWGADKITVHKPAVRARQTNLSARKGNMSPLGFGRESSANAKFGTRLVNLDGPHHHVRPASRRTQVTPTSRRAGTSEDGHSTAKSTVTSTRPAWNGNTRTVTTTPLAPKRPRNNSQTSNSVAPRASSKSLGSPAPSEDSGVGLYRQYMAQDSSLNS